MFFAPEYGTIPIKADLAEAVIMGDIDAGYTARLLICVILFLFRERKIEAVRRAFFDESSPKNIKFVENLETDGHQQSETFRRFLWSSFQFASKCGRPAVGRFAAWSEDDESENLLTKTCSSDAACPSVSAWMPPHVGLFVLLTRSLLKTKPEDNSKSS